MSTTLLSIAQKTILSQSESIARLIDYLDADFEKAVQCIHQCKGRFIITGIGKSAHIAQKIVATLNSTGTPSLFLHAAEAIHGDLGMVQEHDVIMCISKSGNSPEIKTLVALLKNFGNPLIGMTASKSSYLAQESDFIIHAFIDQESCPNNLAPTNSTTAQLVLGDALAICLMELSQFSAQDFAKYHPGGALGKKLLTRISDLISTEAQPQVSPNTPLKDVIVEISSKRLGVTAVVENDLLVGIITDGDLRRMLSQTIQLDNLYAKDIMTHKPKTIQIKDQIMEAFHIMENNAITQLVVLEGTIYKGIIHLHDILKEGIV